MDSWFERVRRNLLEVPSPVMVVAGDDWGLRRVLAGLRDPEQPLIYLDFREIDCSDPVGVGNALSEALRRGLGAALFGLGVTEDYAFAALESLLPALEPITVALSNAEHCPRLALRFLHLVQPSSRLVLHACKRVPEIEIALRKPPMDEVLLRMSVEEAEELFRSEHELDDIEAAVVEAEGAIGAIERALTLDRMTPLSHVGLGDQIGAAFREGASGVVDALVARERWIEAFEFSVDHAPTRLGEVLSEAGNAYFEAGEFERFWRYLSDVPRWIFRQEEFMYWLFNTAVAVNKWRRLLPRVDKFLETHEAPDLRALRSTVEINDRSIVEATRAHEHRRSSETARALAFIYEFEGDFAAAVDLFKEAIELADLEARPRHVVSSAAGIAQVYVFSGEYERASKWGYWALQQYRTHGLREELLRLLTVSVASYPRILVGAVKAAGQVLDTVRLTDSTLGIPSTEGVRSTLGDLALVDGRYDDALEFYRMNVGASSAGTYPTIASDLVFTYLLIGDNATALEVAMQASELADLAPGFQRYVARLNLGAVLVHSDWVAGEEHLRAALDGMEEKPLGPFNARAILHLARSLVRRDRPDEARALMERNARYLRELGDSGWLLLGGDGPEVAELKALFRNDEPELKIRLLGKRSLWSRDGETTLSLRFAELIAVLAANPEGIRGEQLAVALYGDRANPSTLKATISRARKVIPIEPLPYRIAEAHDADFVRVLELLHEGKVQAALELYRGPLLPQSEAPAVVELREHLEESLRQAVLASGDADAMIDLANQQGDDLELWEETRRHLPPNDPRRPLANARIRRIRKRWRAETS